MCWPSFEQVVLVHYAVVLSPVLCSILVVAQNISAVFALLTLLLTFLAKKSLTTHEMILNDGCLSSCKAYVGFVTSE